PVSAHRHTLGRDAFQLEISLVSIRTCGRFDRVLWRPTYRASARRPCVPPNPDSDRILKDVHWCPLSLRRRLRGGYGNLMRASGRSLPVSANPQSPIEIRNLGGGRGEIRTHDSTKRLAA